MNRKPIKGYEGKYEIDWQGNIWSLNFRKMGKSQKLKPGLAGNGYLTVALLKDGKQKTYTVHTLLASAYIPNPHNYPQVNHKNGIKTDCSLSNLEWCTASDNIHHSYRFLNRKKPTSQEWSDAFNRKKLNQRQVKEIYSMKYKVGQKQLAIIYGVSKSAIGSIQTGRSWKWLTQKV